jgi:hypothetical protein
MSNKGIIKKQWNWNGKRDVVELNYQNHYTIFSGLLTAFLNLAYQQL